MNDHAGHTAEALRALCAGALADRPPPWEAMNIPFKVDERMVDSWDVYQHMFGGKEWYSLADDWTEPVVRYVAAANPATVLALLDRVAALEAENARLRAALEEQAKTWQFIAPALAEHGYGCRYFAPFLQLHDPIGKARAALGEASHE